MLYPVILAGGIGSRLWPLSRASLPKQFIQFPGEQGSLFQNTLSRLAGLEDLAAPIVVCNAEHRFLAAEQLRQIGVENAPILLEPVGRNTAPAVAMAAQWALRQSPDARLLVLPADHRIGKPDILKAAIIKAEQLATDDKLITFGIVPDAPETAYGYIEKGDDLGNGDAFAVARFVEKPDRERAEQYLATGNYFWNSGMFLFVAKTYLAELQEHAEDIHASCTAAFSGIESGEDFLPIPEAAFSNCRSDSIDYAVMEKTGSAAVIPLHAPWNDLGAWDALWEVSPKDGDGNVLHGDVLTTGVRNSYIQAGSRLVAGVGLNDVIVVETPDAVLVADKAQAQAVKDIVAGLQAGNRQEVQSPTLVQRPWGSYESLVQGGGYQVKHIIVKPGAALSLQLHHQRAEHWTVIKGTALVICGDREFELQVNESTFIPVGNKHRLSNHGDSPVELIEVQVGDYLGEDDIVRFDDRYGRVGD